MQSDYWHKQHPHKPLFPNMLWSRPENKLYAGKLLIIGGNIHGFAVPAEAYSQADQAGIGVTKVLLPDALYKTLGHTLEVAEFAPSTPSGSFSQKALAEVLSLANWADGVLLAGDLGRNSETAILLEKIAAKYGGPLVITKDAADHYVNTPATVLARPDSLLVISFAQLQRLAREMHHLQAFTYSMGLPRLVQALHFFSLQHAAYIMVRYQDDIIAAVQGRVLSIKTDPDVSAWRVGAAASAAVWWLQNPDKPFEAIATSLAKDL